MSKKNPRESRTGPALKATVVAGLPSGHASLRRKAQAAAPSQPPALQGLTEGMDPRHLEHGILALLSFLGHSYKKGTISDDSYYEAANASLRKLDQIRGPATQAPSRSYDEEAYRNEGSNGLDTQVDKLEKSREDLEAMLSFLEESYTEGSISEESYRELKSENSKRLQRVLRLIAQHDLGSDSVEAQFQRPQPPRRGRAYKEEPEDDPETGMPTSGSDSLSDLEEPPVRASRSVEPANPARVQASPALNLYEDLNESFDSEAVVDETLDIMKELNVRRGGTDFTSSGEGNTSITSSTESDELRFEADAPAAAPAPAADAGKKADPAGAFINKLGGMFQKAAASAPANAPAPAASATAAAANAPAPAAQGGAPAGQQIPPPTAEGPGGQKMWGAGTEEDPYRPTPFPTQAQQTAPVAEEKPQMDFGAGNDGSGSADNAKIILEIEKMKVKLEGLGEMRNSLEERIGHLQEGQGELRQMLFERDAGVKEMDARVAKFIDMVQELDPAVIQKEMEKRDRTLQDFSMRVEKAEALGQDLAQNVNHTKELLESIGSLKNISEVNKDILDKSAKIERTVSKADRLGEEIGRVYVDLNRRLSEFNTYKGKQDLLAESVKDLVTLVESNNAKFEELAPKSELADLKKQNEELRLKIEELQAQEALFEEGRDLPHHVKELKKQKESVELVLSTSEEEFLDRAISKEDYDRVRKENVKRLADIEKQMQAEFAKVMGERRKGDDKAEKIMSSLESAVPQPAPETSLAPQSVPQEPAPQVQPAVSKPAASMSATAPSSLAEELSQESVDAGQDSQSDTEGPEMDSDSDEETDVEDSDSQVDEVMAAISPTLARAKAGAKSTRSNVASEASADSASLQSMESKPLRITRATPQTVSNANLHPHDGPLSDAELDDLQNKLEAQASAGATGKTTTPMAGKSKQLGGMLKATLGNLVSTIKAKEQGILSGKPLRISKKSESETEFASSDVPVSTHVSHVNAPVHVPKTVEQAPAQPVRLERGKTRPFVTWRETRAQQSGPAAKPLPEQARTVAVLKEDPQADEESVQTYAQVPSAQEEIPVSAPSTPAAAAKSAEDDIEARVKALKSLRAQYRAADEQTGAQAARSVVSKLKRSIRVKPKSRASKPARSRTAAARMSKHSKSKLKRR